MTTGTEVALKRKLSDTIAEYDQKLAAVTTEIEAFEQACARLQNSSCIGGTYGRVRIDTGRVNEREMKESLLKSAWYNLYQYLKIDTIASAADKRRFEQSMANPPEFTIENIRASFGDFVLDPYGNIIRGLAEVFCSLDDYYKSHDRVKIGVEGLPKRIILENVSDYGWGKDKLENVINALAAYQRKPLVTYQELNALLEDENALLTDGVKKDRYGTEYKLIGRGIRLKRFKNKNAHLSFEPQELRDINKALADFYGDVLADCHEAKAEQKKAGTEVAKDLQYYPTPKEVVDRVVENLYSLEGKKVLEPSAGCGRFMDALRAKGAEVIGIEIDPGRFQQCQEKGHKVICKNFLETVPTPIFDRVVMNPPFYGKHYAKHIDHAWKFLKEDGVLTAILPAAARYDHGLLDKYFEGLDSWKLRQCWQDLPVGSFRDSGTNINTCILTLRKTK